MLDINTALSQLPCAQGSIIAVASAQHAACKGQPRQIAWWHWGIGNPFCSFTALIFNNHFGQRPHLQKISVINLLISVRRSNPMQNSGHELIDLIVMKVKRVIAFKNLHSFARQAFLKELGEAFGVNALSLRQQCNGFFSQWQDVQFYPFISNLNFSKHHLALQPDSAFLQCFINFNAAATDGVASGDLQIGVSAYD